MTGSEYRVFAALSQSVGLTIPFTGLSVGEVFDRFRSGLDQSHIIFIIVLDEVDALIKEQRRRLHVRINPNKRNPPTKAKSQSSAYPTIYASKNFSTHASSAHLSEEELVFRPYDAGGTPKHTA